MADTNTAPTVSGPVTLDPLREDAVRIITAAELLQFASDAPSDDLTVKNLTISSGNGELVDKGDGTWIFTPKTDDDTAVTFAYDVSDGKLSTGTTATLDLLPVYDVILSGKGGGARYTGTDGAEDIFGNRGNDRVNAAGGEDQVWGGDANDRLYGGDANDLVDGGKGNDRVYGDDGDDQVLGGIGNDWAYGGAGADIVGGGVGNDHVYGGEDNDQVAGDTGNDHVYGEDGDDNVSGGAGNDMVNGGEGDDILSGGAGHDRFVFEGAFGQDTITDFDIHRDLLQINGNSYSQGSFDQLVVTEVDDTTVRFEDGEGNSITLENVDPNDFSLV